MRRRLISMSKSMDVTIDDDGYSSFCRSVPVVEYHMLDKHKYFPLVALSGLTVRTLLYPFSLIKTRLQVQKSKTLYAGTFDAFRHIFKVEGARGLYSGFLVHNLSMASQMTFMTTYEGMRHYLANHHSFSTNRQRSFIAGGVASVIAQTVVVPVDVVSQHLQMKSVYKHHQFDPAMAEKALPLKRDAEGFRFGATKAVVLAIIKQNGYRGFYKGFLISVITYGPTSAIWWLSYDCFCDMLSLVAPIWMPRLSLQCLAAPLSGVTTTLITTPLDAIRARVQVENTKFLVTAKTLWQEEHLGIFAKGLSPRLIQSIMTSFFVILGYETIKRWSLLDEYKNDVRW